MYISNHKNMYKQTCDHIAISSYLKKALLSTNVGQDPRLIESLYNIYLSK